MSLLNTNVGGCQLLSGRQWSPVLKRRVVSRAVEEDVTPPLQRPTLNRPTLKREETQTQTTEVSRSVITIEFQRRMAKEMTNYFRAIKEEETMKKSQVFGFTENNEITNGRWVMMGVAIGLLTEYSTGVNFIDQLKLMVSYLGIADIYD
eukprot:TRINITY_DN913_c0_g2_i3.p2 TRINITY_DN913_c0_g2~~TRINITY_DN913_c0_g2_i3.p2  ORF type:complete len:149 (+),score=16.71 TRINITY_DN913_c0_g2_i3:162-608(+)